MSNIFISYNRQSENFTKILANDIEKLGHTVWFDQELSGGQAWWDQILASVRSCDVFVLDPAALNSTACKREYIYAAALGKSILPVLASDGVSTNLLPPALSQIQFVDHRRQDRDAGLRLARALATVPPSKPLPDPLPAPPEAPISYLGGLTEQVDMSSTLSYEQQSALVVDFKRSLRDPKTTDDTRTLLERLRKRHDLYAKIAEEIDELLRVPKQSPEVQPRTPEPEPIPKVGVSQHTDKRTPPTTTLKMIVRERLQSAFVGLIVCFLASFVFLRPNDWAIGAVYLGICGAITGAITGTHRKVIFFAIIGLVFVVFISLKNNVNESEIAYAAPFGTIFGAIVGVIIKKMKGWA